VRLQDFSNLDSTQESKILDEAKTILEHLKTFQVLMAQKCKHFCCAQEPDTPFTSVDGF